MRENDLQVAHTLSEQMLSLLNMKRVKNIPGAVICLLFEHLMVDGLIIQFAGGGFLLTGCAFTFATQLRGIMLEEQMGRKKSHISLRGEASKELFYLNLLM